MHAKRMRPVAALSAMIALSYAMGGLVQADDSVEPRSVELFAAMEAGDIEVRLIPRNARESNIMIQNNTERPLRIEMPEAFAGVPVLAQFGGGNQGGGGFGGGGGGGNQGVGGGGGGFGGGGGGGGGFGGGGGQFNIEAQREVRIRVQTVCLEHGLADPNPRIAYKLIPISEFTQDASVIEICKMLGRGELDQVSAQAAAWNLTDDLSWDTLASKVRVRHRFGSDEYFFNRNQLLSAMAAVNVAARRSEDSEGKTSLSDVTTSTSAAE